MKKDHFETIYHQGELFSLNTQEIITIFSTSYYKSTNNFSYIALVFLYECAGHLVFVNYFKINLLTNQFFLYITNNSHKLRPDDRIIRAEQLSKIIIIANWHTLFSQITYWEILKCAILRTKPITQAAQVRAVEYWISLNYS